MSDIIEGTDHIWLSENSATELGRQLSVGYSRSIHHSEYGSFSSFLAVILYFQHNQNDAFRDVTGMNRDLMGINLGFNTVTPGAIQKANSVIEDHITSDATLLSRIRENTLPYMAYVLISLNGAQTPIKTSQLEWYINLLNRIGSKK